MLSLLDSGWLPHDTKSEIEGKRYQKQLTPPPSSRFSKLLIDTKPGAHYTCICIVFDPPSSSEWVAGTYAPSIPSSAGANTATGRYIPCPNFPSLQPHLLVCRSPTQGSSVSLSFFYRACFSSVEMGSIFSATVRHKPIPNLQDIDFPRDVISKERNWRRALTFDWNSLHFEWRNGEVTRKVPP